MRAHRGLILAAACLLPAPALAQAPWTVVEQWRWDGATRSPSHPDVAGTPVVLQLTDDDGNGVLDSRDRTDVAFVHSQVFGVRGLLSVLDGATGATQLATAAPELLQAALAAGDVDGDGAAELVSVAYPGDDFAILEGDGSVAALVPVPGGRAGVGTTVGLADLDGDGIPELFADGAVTNLPGSLAWRAAPTGGPGFFETTVTNAADVLPASAGAELLVGNAAYRPDGSPAWVASGARDGFTALGDLDGDGSPEIVVAELRGVVALDRNGAVLAGPLAIPAPPGMPPSAPAVADFDGDGLDEVVVSGSASTLCLELAGGALSLRWSVPSLTRGRLACATAFDLDGDGAAEALVRDADGWRILDGRTGAALHSASFPSFTSLDAPIVANIDADAAPEVLVAGSEAPPPDPGLSALVAYEVVGAQPARCIWNERMHHGTNVEDDGTIPAIEPLDLAALAGWPAQEARACGASCGTCDALRETVAALDVAPEGVRRSLEAKVEAACRAWERGQPRTAGNVLCALLHECDAQEGRHLAADSAEALRACVRAFAEASSIALERCTTD